MCHPKLYKMTENLLVYLATIDLYSAMPSFSRRSQHWKNSMAKHPAQSLAKR